VGYLSTKWNGGSWPKGDLIKWFDTGLVKYANVYMQFFWRSCASKEGSKTGAPRGRLAGDLSLYEYAGL
jgi:hypothetical protein